ncbi:MAG: 3-phosphoshikimate 1-carboxyvinyltransferase [Bdellovibrionales bacterium]|nr:3-phosphoshikimate 1-carboxyvinyltransferase [Bdellovibrionales bacterium]
MNRALVAQSFFPDLEVIGQSEAADVKHMTEALAQIGSSNVFQCGEGGTVLRFLALRLSREQGEFVLEGSPKLFSRPQEELVHILKQLGVSAVLDSSRLMIKSKGWRPQGDTLLVPCGKSSQFLSAVILSAWDLPFDLFVSPQSLGLSLSYFKMTQQLLMNLGMNFKHWDHDFCVLKNQTISKEQISIEPDMSSCFSLAAVAAISGNLLLSDFPPISLQPDHSFIEVLRVMGVPIEISNERLKVTQAEALKPVSVNLKDTPDLFPVLAALCGLAEGESVLYGAPHLAHKESSRIQKVSELLSKIGCRVEEREDGLVIRPPEGSYRRNFSFDPEGDHRLAMAAAVLLKSGLEFDLLHPEVVEKSFPEFWFSIGMKN